MDKESATTTRAPHPKGFRRSPFIIGTLGTFTGLLATSNALDFGRSMNPTIGIGEMVVGGLLACFACRQRRDFVWLSKIIVFQLATCLALFGTVRLVRLAFGAPWSIFSGQALLPLALTLLGVLSVRLAYRLLRAGDGVHPLY